MNKLLPVITYARVDIKRLFRDKVGIFFIFVFPLIFLLVFGSLFGGDQDISFSVVVENESDSEFALGFVEQIDENEIFEVDRDIVNDTDGLEAIRRGSIDAIITLPEDFGEVDPELGYPTGQAEVVYDRGNEQAGATLDSILSSIFSEINSEIAPVETPFRVATEPTEDEGLTTLDYIFPGLLGFTILSLGVFGPTTVFPRMKEKGILRRYHTTPIRVWQYFAANVISNSVVGLLAVAVMFGVALAVFDVSMRGDYISLALLTVLGTVVLFGVGLAAGGWAKNENQAAPLGNLVAFPMMFLSGVFFPRFLMPEWLQSISDFLPLTPLVDGLRMIIAESQTIFEIGPEIGMLLGWMVVVYAVAFKVFRWE